MCEIAIGIDKFRSRKNVKTTTPSKGTDPKEMEVALPIPGMVLERKVLFS